MFERFTDRARRIFVLAQEEARLLSHNFIGTEHIMHGLVHEGDGVAATALASLGVSLEAVRGRVRAKIGPAEQFDPAGSPPFTPRAKKVLELSLREALQLGHNYIGTEHMLLAIVREGEGLAAEVLVELGADLSRVRQQVIQLLSGYAGGQSSERPAPGAGRHHALVEPGPGVAAVAVPIEPTALVTWDDVEEALRTAASLARATVTAWDDMGVAHRSCAYEPKAPPTITISVAGANVSSEAFERTNAPLTAEPIEGVGTAIYDEATSSLRVLTRSVVFSVTVQGHPDPRAVAATLARKAAARLDSAS